MSNFNDGMKSSNTDLWATPQHFFDTFNEHFLFDVDVCASPENSKCPKYYTKEDDGLSHRWEGSCWMNPPYGREIGAWVQKAAESSLKGLATVVCLLPARTDTAWWHDWVVPFGEVIFVRGRLKFGNAKASAPFPSAVVIFRNSNEERLIPQLETISSK